MKAKWKGRIIAESDQTKIVENNHYFPMEDIEQDYFKKSESRSRCPWKGEASYFHLEIDGELNKDAALYYPQASHAAKPIENHVAFRKGIKITE